MSEECRFSQKRPFKNRFHFNTDNILNVFLPSGSRDNGIEGQTSAHGLSINRGICFLKVFFNVYLLEILELLVSGQPLLLVHASVNGDGGEVLLDQELGEGNAALDALHEDDNLK